MIYLNAVSADDVPQFNCENFRKVLDEKSKNNGGNVIALSAAFKTLYENTFRWSNDRICASAPSLRINKL